MLLCPLCLDFVYRIQKIFYCEIWQLRVNYHQHNRKVHKNLPPLWNKLYALVIINGTSKHTQFLNFHLWKVFKYQINYQLTFIVVLFISKPAHKTNKQTKNSTVHLLQFHDSNWFLIILLVRKQWETKYHTKKLTLNVALSFFSFALGVDHTPWWKKNITLFQHSAGVHVHKAQIGNNLLTKQQ